MERIEKIKNDNLSVSLDMAEEGFLELSLINKKGTLIYNFCKLVKNGLFQHFINVKYMENGSYFLRVSVNGNSEVSQFNI